MKPVKLLALYNDYLTSQRNVALFMIWAIEYFDRGREDMSWSYLFEWEETKDKRDAIWRKLQDRYFDALMAREGVMK